MNSLTQFPGAKRILLAIRLLSRFVRLPARPRALSVRSTYRGDIQLLPITNLAELSRLTLPELRAEWSKHFGSPPTLRSADLLRLTLAWRLQARRLGGLDLSIRRKLKGRGPVFAEGVDLGPGTKLTRRWKGQTEEVSVEGNGFRWKGHHFPSLSAVALAMTGTRLNGPKFFGLRRKNR